MATSSEEGHLTNKQIVLLSTAIEYKKMKSIALGYLGLSIEKISSLSQTHREDYEAFNREIIYNWMCRNSGSDQTKKLAGILYKVAAEGSYVDPDKVQEILEVSREEATIFTPTSGKTETNTEDCIRKTAETLQEHYRRTLKIEMAPWAKGYTVEMKDMYTEVALEKVENKPSGPNTISVTNYQDLFDINLNRNEIQHKDERKRQPSKIPVPVKSGKSSPLPKTKAKNIQRKSSNRNKSTSNSSRSFGKRVLIKAEPGMGKTTLARKMAWDWAMGIFTTFSIVFLISLKLMRPGDAIENVIIEQLTPLKDMKISSKIVKDILDNFGSRCLIILDGFDELFPTVQSYENSEIKKIVEGQKLYKCHTLLTTRPHITAEIETKFDTVASLLGFSKQHAQSFVSKILVNDRKQRRAVRFFFDHKIVADCRNTCPMILMFVCLLSKNEELSDIKGKLVRGEIYFRLLRSMHRKYCERKGIKFNLNDFVEILKKVGKIALDTLISTKYTYQKSNIVQDIGEDAFEYGYIIGHEDYRLFLDESADVCINFPHFTIQEFLGALGFIVALSENKNIDDILVAHIKEPVFLVFPMFFRFCLWFLCGPQLHITFANKKDIYESMKKCALKRIDFRQQDPSGLCVIFPALNLLSAFEDDDIFAKAFFQDLLSNCKNTRYLRNGNDDPISWVFNSLEHILNQLCYIEIRNKSLISYLFVVDGRHYHKFNFEDLNILIRSLDDIITLEKVLFHLEKVRKPKSLFVVLSGLEKQIDFSIFTSLQIQKLQLICEFPTECIVTSQALNQQNCRSLTHLSIQGLHVDETLMIVLCSAVRTGLLPCFFKFKVETCEMLNGKLALLFHSAWPELRDLDLGFCFLDAADIQILSEARQLLPKLSSLAVCLHDEYNVPDETCTMTRSSNDISVAKLFTTKWPFLTQLRIDGVNESEYRIIVSSLNSEHFPALAGIHITCSSSFVLPRSRKELRTQPNIGLPSLKYVTLGYFISSVRHLYLLTRISPLTNLLKLDISNSTGILGSLCMLLCHTFPYLTDLCLFNCGLNSKDISNLARAAVKKRLPVLRHLDISENDGIIDNCESLFSYEADWNGLESLSCYLPQSDEVFTCIAQQVQLFNLVSLRELKISGYKSKPLQPMGDACWHHLSILNLCSDKLGLFSTASYLNEAVGKGIFPSLERVLITWKKTALDSETEIEFGNIYKELEIRLSEQLPKPFVLNFINGLHQAIRARRELPSDEEDNNNNDNLSEPRRRLFKVSFKKAARMVLEAFSFPVTSEQKEFLLSAVEDFSEMFLTPKYGHLRSHFYFDENDPSICRSMFQKHKISVFFCT